MVPDIGKGLVLLAWGAGITALAVPLLGVVIGGLTARFTPGISAAAGALLGLATGLLGIGLVALWLWLAFSFDFPLPHGNTLIYTLLVVAWSGAVAPVLLVQLARLKR